MVLILQLQKAYIKSYVSCENNSELTELKAKNVL